MKSFTSFSEYQESIYPSRTAARKLEEARKEREQRDHLSGSRLDKETRKKIKDDIRSVLA